MPVKIGLRRADVIGSTNCCQVDSVRGLTELAGIFASTAVASAILAIFPRFLRKLRSMRILAVFQKAGKELGMMERNCTWKDRRKRSA
jgi:hypothetical protein